MKIVLLLLFVVFFLSPAVSGYQSGLGVTPEAMPNLTVLLMGDIHFDGLYGRPGGYGFCNQGQSAITTAGCDSPERLIHSLVSDAVKQDGNHSLISGGLMRHGNGKLNFDSLVSMLKTVLLSFSRLNNRTVLNVDSENEIDEGPDLAAQIALGVTDFHPDGTFTPRVQEPFFTHFVNLMKEYDLISDREKTLMKPCGFYYRDINGTKLRVITLNTVLWSSDLRPSLGIGEVDPCGQFPFLQNAIEDAAQRKRNVIILGSVPPTLNIVEAVRNGEVSEQHCYWRKDFREAYLRLIATYRYTVAAQFFAHIEYFGFVASVEVGPPMYIIPPLSPMRGANPSYLIASLDAKTGRVVGLKQRYILSTEVWKDGYSLEEVFPTPLKNLGEYLQKNYLSFADSDTKWARFLEMRYGGLFLQDLPVCRTWCRRVILCASMYYDPKDIQQCAFVALPSQKIGVILGAVFTSFGVISVLLSAIYVMWNYHDVFGPPAAVEGGKMRRYVFSERKKRVY